MKPQIVEKAEKVKGNLKTKLDLDKRSFRWFYGEKLGIAEITYQSFMGMMNGYGNIKPCVEDEINKYLNEKF